MGRNNACLPNLEPLMQFGINPKTGLPIKFDLDNPVALKENIRKQLRVQDEQMAVNKGKWYNIPCDITSQMLERMLYYKYKLCLFYCKDLEKFFILPFTLAAPEGNGLDEYGRYQYIRPICFNGGATEENKKKTPLEEYLSSLTLKVRYAPVLPDELTVEDFENSAVILFDYTPQFNTMDGIPRYNLQEPLLDVMAECIPYARTNMITSCGIKGLRVQDADEKADVYEANRGIKMGAMTGEAYVPIEGKMEFQELTDNNTGKVQDYFLVMQSLKNYQTSLYGLNSGGVFEKKAHELQGEAAANGGPDALIMQDYTSIRQNACNIANSIWNMGLWYEPSETQTMADMNGDGVLYDRNETGENSGMEDSVNDSNV